MPVPIIITEPAVGEGLGLALVFFHPPEGYSAEQNENLEKEVSVDLPELDPGVEADPGSVAQTKFVLPDVSAVAAGATNNDSWFVGGGHFAEIGS